MKNNSSGEKTHARKRSYRRIHQTFLVYFIYIIPAPWVTGVTGVTGPTASCTCHAVSISPSTLSLYLTSLISAFNSWDFVHFPGMWETVHPARWQQAAVASCVSAASCCNMLFILIFTAFQTSAAPPPL